MATHWTGRVLGERYVIEDSLGSGGAAEVYEAQDRQLERQVAVKVLRPAWARDAATAANFRREAQLAARLHHPHLAQVYDVGVEAGLPYIVMERVPGASLDTVMRRDVGQALDIATQIASALAFVHDNGLLHGDVKPANVLVDAQGQAKLVDFGRAYPLDEPTARPASAAPGGATQKLLIGQVSPGTVPYLAPERLAGRPPSPASDVYSLGAVLYRMLAGRPPYTGDSPDVIRRAQQAGPPPALHQLNPAVPPALEGLVRRALAPDAAARFGSAAEMEAALTTIRDQSRQFTAAYVPAVPPAPPQRTPSWGLPAVAGGVILALLALLAFLIKPPIDPDLAAALPTATMHLATAVASGPATVTLPPSATTVSTPTAVVALRPAPKFTSLLLQDAAKQAQQGGWALHAVAGDYSTTVERWRVLTQQPEAGTPLPKGAPIRVIYSRGPPPPTQGSGAP